jgi:hypothetical protein
MEGVETTPATGTAATASASTSYFPPLPAVDIPETGPPLSEAQVQVAAQARSYMAERGMSVAPSKYRSIIFCDGLK